VAMRGICLRPPYSQMCLVWGKRIPTYYLPSPRGRALGRAFGVGGMCSMSTQDLPQNPHIT